MPRRQHPPTAVFAVGARPRTSGLNAHLISRLAAELGPVFSLPYGAHSAVNPCRGVGSHADSGVLPLGSTRSETARVPPGG